LPATGWAHREKAGARRSPNRRIADLAARFRAAVTAMKRPAARSPGGETQKNVTKKQRARIA
jgi:hypothetical protein